MPFTHVLGLLSVCSNNVLGLLPHTNVCTKLTSSHQRLYEAHKPVILTSHQLPSGLRDAQAVGWASMTTLSSRSPSSLPTRCVENYGGDCRRLFALIYIVIYQLNAVAEKCLHHKQRTCTASRPPPPSSSWLTDEFTLPPASASTRTYLSPSI